MTNDVMKYHNAQPRSRNGRAKAPSLQEACLFFDINYPDNAHRALIDAKITAKVAIKASQKWRDLPKD
jgi:DNA polymerase III epsilon subunit-like protein